MSTRVIQVRPSRDPRWKRHGGWEVYEGEGVSPVYCSPDARELALSYARQRAAGYGPTEIRVFDTGWQIADTLLPEDGRGLI